MRVLELAFIFLIVICIISVAKSEKGRKVKGKLTNIAGSPSRKNGKFNFQDEMSVMLDIEGVETSLAVKRADIKVPSKPPSQKNSEVAAYQNEENGVFCLEMCEGQCDVRCKKQTAEGLYYFTGEAVLFLGSSDGTIDAILDQKDMTVTADGKVKVKAKEGQKQSQNLHGNRIKQVQPKMAERLSKIKTTKSASRRDIRDAHKRDTTLLKEKPDVRERRALVPDVESDVAVIKLMLVLDLGFTERIADLVGNNVNNITAESEKFLALIVNEFAYHYGSLENYGNSFTLNGTPHPLNMTVFLNSIVFPPLNTAGTEFVNFDWSGYHVGFKDFGQSSEKALFAYHYYLRNRYWYSEYPIYSFGEWLKNSGLSGYDVAHAITGYDLADLSLTYFRGTWYYRDEETNVIGLYIVYFKATSFVKIHDFE
ncbi:uncharacterized protein LOC128557314 [Mercenaria mercenaria]|uniref:uncharacterized protein LOC128557314 n=1 Tax=Mercenaria mercenaria TaxID=6596 RepID=UPI00234EFE66|nr:uncharacterized protein LOC128557314 [Mercenaria mercenaria]